MQSAIQKTINTNTDMSRHKKVALIAMVDIVVVGATTSFSYRIGRPTFIFVYPVTLLLYYLLP
ncbi:hypothetical protein EDC96DRAFT_523432 [Choanephora cucurbitarum]|nr:hypothetical protein EDC96DRAFT_523663 [Choanephora cucurbitarum]KAI8337819.1 hypothetical protein EDC96DRAFT_523432 [Choanephora cucurbitarum]